MRRTGLFRVCSPGKAREFEEMRNKFLGTGLMESALGMSNPDVKRGSAGIRLL
jgi:hypothetical protein